MAIRDVEVVISRDTQAVTQAGFGTPLILATLNEHPYTNYSSIDAVAEDFEEGTEAYAIASRVFGQSPRPAEVAIIGVTYDPATDEPAALTSALNEHAGEDFYFLLCEEQGKEEIQALSGWAEANKKIYAVSTDDPTLPIDIESDRTIILVHKDPLSYPAEGWVGACAAQDPGSITWKFKTINGILNAGFSDSEINDIVEAGGNTYIRQGGTLHTYDGRATSGEWIDIIRSQDYIESRIKESVFQTLVSSPKVPYTNAGIAQIVVAAESELQSAFNNGMIAEDEDGQALYNVTAPNRNDVPTNDRAQRILPDVHFELELAGAIHKTKIQGVISV